jgi:rhodanese-related sulfurtransferase
MSVVARATTLRGVAELTPEEAWERVRRGEARILDLRTGLERRRYGSPPGAEPVSLLRHALSPAGPEAIYLCQHGVRSRVAGRGEGCGVAGGFAAWAKAGLPVEHDEGGAA